MKTLTLPIKRFWFNQIIDGSKTVEYREIKQYWQDRLEGDGGQIRQYDRIVFRVGYHKHCLWAIFECIDIVKNTKSGFYEITLGRRLAWSGWFC